jgi:hypothetical protein
MKLASGGAFLMALLDGQIGKETRVNVVKKSLSDGTIYGVSLTNDEGVSYFEVSPYEISVDIWNALITHDKAVVEVKADNMADGFTYSLRVDVRG